MNRLIFLFIVAASFVAAQTQSYTVGVGGVTANTLVQLNASGLAVALTSDAMLAGIASSTASQGAPVTVTTGGSGSCVFENATTAGDLVIAGTGTAQDCRDSGQTSAGSVTAGARILGTVTQSVSASATATLVFGSVNSYWYGGVASSGSGGGTWGSITGTLSSQSDLNTALGAKLTAPVANASLTNSSITIAGHSVSLGGTQTIACADLSNAAASCATDATNAANISGGALPAGRMPALTGDITTSAGAVATTLATVNSGSGSCGDATHVCAVTTNGKGLVTSQTATAITGPVSSVFTRTGAVVAASGDYTLDQISNPAANVALALPSANTLTLTAGAATSTNSPFTFQDTASNTGTGYVFSAGTATGSAAGPFRVVCKGSSCLTVDGSGNVIAGLGSITSNGGYVQGQTGIRVGNGAFVTFSNGTNFSNTALGRNADGVVEVNNGAACSTAANCRDIAVRSYVVKGTVPSISGCSAGTQTGGGTAGTFSSGTTGTCTVTLTFALTAPNGWYCGANDLTTNADTVHQTASSTTTATMSGTTVSGDVVNFGCVAY